MGCARGRGSRRGKGGIGTSFVPCFICLLCFLCLPVVAQATTVSGSVRDAAGAPIASGKLILRLSQEGTVSDPALLLIQPPVSCTITNGDIAGGCVVRGNDTISPAGTFYRVRIVSATGQELLPERRYLISGTTFDLGTATALVSDIIAAQAYQVVQDEGTNLTQRQKLNLTGTGVTCTDNSSQARTDCTVSGGGGSGSTHQIDGVALTAQDPINFQDTPTIDFTNPSAGNIQATIKDSSVTAAKLAVTSPSGAQLDGVGDSNLAAGALSPNRISGTAEVLSSKDAANGYAGLDGSSKIAAAQIQEVIQLDHLTDVAAMTEATGDLLYHTAGSWNRLARGAAGQCLTSDASTILWGSCGGAGGGDNLSVGGSATSDANFSNTNPAAPSDGVNVRFQLDTAATPDDISANLPFATGSAAGAVSAAAQTFAGQKTFSGGIIFRDNNTEFQDDLDNTKKVTLQLANIATATTRTWTAPNASGEISLLGQTIEDAELASNYSGVGACTNQFVRSVNDNAAPTCATIGKADAASTFVHTDQANTFSAGAQDFAAAASLKVPTSAGASPTASGLVAYDSTSNTLEYGENGTNRALVASARAVNTSAPLSGGGDLSADRTIACATCTTDTNTQTLTNKTLNVEGTGNVVTTVSKQTFLAAGCNNTTAGPGWDLPTSNAPSASCYGTSPQRFGGLDFADGAAALTSTTHLRLPADWTGSIDVAFLWFSGSTSTNSAVWTLATACIADGEDLLTPTFNTAQTVADANNATANTRNSATISSITTTGCAVGETLFLRIGRDPTNGSDTLAATAVLLEFEVTLRRAQ